MRKQVDNKRLSTVSISGFFHKFNSRYNDLLSKYNRMLTEGFIPIVRP